MASAVRLNVSWAEANKRIGNGTTGETPADSIRRQINLRNCEAFGYMPELINWIEERSVQGFEWILKRLSRTDTGACGTHQAGPYLRRSWLLERIPDLNQPNVNNPNFRLRLHIDSHDEHREVKAIWYNNRLQGGTRNETRLTRLRGNESALLNPVNAGLICAFVFGIDHNVCHAWICRDGDEEATIQNFIEKDVVPRKFVTWSPAGDV